MSKRLFLLFFLIYYKTYASYGQDIMVMKNGDEVKVKITEILPDVVKYKKWDNQTGPSYTEYKASIFMIKYQNGTKDVFNQQTLQAPVAAPTLSTDEIRKNEAVEKVKNYLINWVNSAQGQPLQFLNFTKTNGIPLNINGQPVYVIYYDVTLRFRVPSWLAGNGMVGYWRNNFSVYTSQPQLNPPDSYMYDLKYYAPGTTVILSCEATMASTDNGYEITKNTIKNERNLGVREIQSNINSSSNGSRHLTHVDMDSFSGGLSTPTGDFALKIGKVEIVDELNNAEEIKSVLIKYLQQNKRLQSAHTNFLDTLRLSSAMAFSYRNYTNNNTPTFFADCNVSLNLTSIRTGQVICKNQYKLTNFSLLAKPFGSKTDAEHDLIDNNFDRIISQFIIGNFPIVGSITQIVEKNNKQDEARSVKIDVGKDHGTLVGFEFVIPELNQEKKKTDIVITEVYDDYAIGKVKNNEKKIVGLMANGQKLKIQTKYTP